MTNSSGQLVKEIGYQPFGETAYANDFLSTNVSVKYQFTGQKKDATGLMDYNARMYDPELGRFISADPVLDGLNRYTYCKNNPIRYTDPTGDISQEAAVALTGYLTSVNNGKSPTPTETVKEASKEYLSYLAYNYVNNNLMNGNLQPNPLLDTLGVAGLVVSFAGAKEMDAVCAVLGIAIAGYAGLQYAHEQLNNPSVTHSTANIDVANDAGKGEEDSNGAAGAGAAADAGKTAGKAKTPEEIKKDIDKNHEEVNKAIKDSKPTTTDPWQPPDIKPAGEEPPPTFIGKVAWTIGKILEIIDNIGGK